MIGVMIVSDIRLYRESLTSLVAGAGFEVVNCVETEVEACALAAESRPDVILIDSAMEESIRVVRSLVAMGGETPIVALTLPSAEEEVVAFAEAGVAGYVTRDAALDDLARAIDASSRGEALCSPRLAGALLRRVASLAAEHRPERPQAALTAREREVMLLMDEGLTNKQIAQRLLIEVPTVKNHVHNILEKLGVNRRGEAVARLHRSRGTGS
jgi:two-component system, NarL family, nitrate/nitrite response regulator NarL